MKKTLRSLKIISRTIFLMTLLVLIIISCNSVSKEPEIDKNETINPGDGTSYYVSLSGDDSNDGSINNPWRTIKKASDTLIEGDIVFIRSGTYNERIIPKNSGTTKYITYSSYNEEVVTIDGSGITLPSDWGGLFDITGKSFIKVSGLRIINAGKGDNSCGILVDNSSNILIENNYTYNTVSSGIGVWDSNNVILDGNEVVLACNNGEQECITVAVTDVFEIKNNSVHDSGPGSIGGEGIDAKDGATNGRIFSNTVYNINRLGIYADSWDKHTYNIEIFSNRVYNCRGDGIVIAAENGGLLENILIYNNLVYKNSNSGITTGDWGVKGEKHPLKDIYIINNTIYNNGSEWGGGISIFNSETENLVIRNNILNDNILFQIAAEVSDKSFITADFNLIHDFRGYQYEITGINTVTGDPLFVNPFSFDFHIKAGSPAIDSGSSDKAPATDFDGNTRPLGSGYDIGAFEYK